MALNNNNDGTNEARTRNYKLCCVCKFKGVRGNPMVICTACGENVHSSNSCSKILNHNKSNNNIKKKINIDNVDTDDSTQYICTTFKIKRKSSQAPTLIDSRRSDQPRRKSGNNICSIPTHHDFQQQIHKINDSLKVLFNRSR